MSSLLARQTGRINRRVVEVGEFQKATKPITDFVCQGATWVECQLGRVNNTSNLLKFELTRFHRDQPIIATQTNFFKIRPHTNDHEFEAHWTAIDKDLWKLEKYTLIPGLSMNYFFGV